MRHLSGAVPHRVMPPSGYDGGTGTSPLGSIKNAGSPWELGLSEAHQALVEKDLRGRVVLRCDGGLKTGRDVAVAAALGAEEFGFGTAAIVAAGCVMARQCHANTCPVGIATQREDLRARFAGTPEDVIDFFTFVAMEVRAILAGLGLRSLDDLVGRADLLERRPAADLPAGFEKTWGLDLAPILADPDETGTKARRSCVARNDRPSDESLESDLLEAARPLLERGERVTIEREIRNVHRSVGARLAGEIARRALEGTSPLPPDGAFTARFRGHAGQSFGAFACAGMRLLLEGDANDYVAKGLSGGTVAIAPPPGHRFVAHENVIAGNTVLYGATSGRFFLAGRAGERFAVRNSGATAVAEGCGDHGCEYMTGGTVLLLGHTGRNFGAGMSGGVAYVYDEDRSLAARLNPEMVRLERPLGADALETVRRLLDAHREATGSERAASILGRWAECAPRFAAVVPKPAEAIEKAAPPAIAGAARPAR